MTQYRRRDGASKRRMAGAMALAGMLLAGCEDGTGLGFLTPREGGAGQTAAAQPGNATRLVERDVEAPEVFQVTEAGLWDGRPSLGGVWVAHPEVREPNRVIIRNQDSGDFVIGALFRREREIPGPRLQVSSDAAAALGMLAGQPAQLNVTALTREQVADTPPDASEDTTATGTLDAPGEIEATALDPVAAGAAAALDEAATAGPDGAIAGPTEAAPDARPPRPASTLDKPFIQIGIFSIEQNARNTATAMRQAGMIPTVLKQESAGKTFWRVLVGPATNRSERAALLAKIKDAGFSDAYAVTN